jgi:holo-[acyl-carrier protein] synthase
MQQIGVDIIEISRIKEAISRWGDNFLNRVYTESELKLYSGKPASLAARFSGKEAVIKALGSENIYMHDIEILSDDFGKPEVRLYGAAQQRAGEKGLYNIAVSLSHCREYAVACAVGEMHPIGGVPPNEL